MNNRSLSIIACNQAGVITTASLQYDESDEDEVIQLRIGEYQYKFNNEGKLITTEPNPQGVCINNYDSKSNCAQKPSHYTCIPTYSKTED